MATKHKFITNIVVKGDSVTLLFKGSVRDANKLRRIFLTQIPTMAFSKIFIRRNNSVRTDEFLKHRLGVIPILVDATELKEDTLIKMHLDQTGGTVYSQSITGGKVMADIIVTKLKQHQSLTVDMIARKGFGNEDARWSAVSTVGFKPIKDGLVELRVKSIGIYTPKKLVEIAMKIYGADN